MLRRVEATQVKGRPGRHGNRPGCGRVEVVCPTRKTKRWGEGEGERFMIRGWRGGFIEKVTACHHVVSYARRRNTNLPARRCPRSALILPRVMIHVNSVQRPTMCGHVTSSALQCALTWRLAANNSQAVETHALKTPLGPSGSNQSGEVTRYRSAPAGWLWIPCWHPWLDSLNCSLESVRKRAGGGQKVGCNLGTGGKPGKCKVTGL